MKKRERQSGEKQQTTLASKLADVDPDFAEFLKTEDSELLDVDLDEVEADSEGEELDIDDEEEADDSEDIVASSEDEEDVKTALAVQKAKKSAEKDGDQSLTMLQLHEWAESLTQVMSGGVNEKSARLLIDKVVAALRCAADKMQPTEKHDESSRKKKKKGKDDDSENGSDDAEGNDGFKKIKKTAFSKFFGYVGAREFHALVKLCISHLVPSFLAVVKCPIKSGGSLQQRANALRNCSSWSRIKLSIRVYIETVVELVKLTSDENVATELLAHLNTNNAQVLIYALPATRRTLIQTVVRIWSKGSLISSPELFTQCHGLILTTLRNCPAAKVSALYERMFRRLYRAFMVACKFPAKVADDKVLETAATMRDQLASFVLIAPLPAMAHTLAFVKIRQLCGQLRAALLAASSDTRARATKLVLSWPFLYCIDLWVEVVCKSPDGHAVRQLVYPLTQLIIGTARLQPSPRYYPLRWRCIRYLNRLAFTTNTFIPTVSLVLDLFSLSDFNAAASVKNKTPLGDDRRVTSLANVLHFSESQLKEPGIDGGILDAVVNDLLYLTTCETLSNYAHRIAFPELSLALVVRLKKFVKVCHVPRFAEKMKVLSEKIEENSRWIEKRRRSSPDLHPANTAAVTAWEAEARSAFPPLQQFFRRLDSTRDLFKMKTKKEHGANRKRKTVLKDEPSQKVAGNKMPRKAKMKKRFNNKREKRLKKEVS